VVEKNLFGFQWFVPEGGFRWVEGYEYWRELDPLNNADPGKKHFGKEPAWFTVHPRPVQARHYDPFRAEPRLYVRFANTEPTLEGVLEFANAYGPLTILDHDLIVSEPDLGAEDAPGGILTGEPCFLWTANILWMRHLLTLWTLCQRKDLAGLRRWVSWDATGRVAYSRPDHARCQTSWCPSSHRGVNVRYWFEGLFSLPPEQEPSDYAADEPGRTLAWTLNNLVKRGDAVGAVRAFVVAGINHQLLHPRQVNMALYWSSDGPPYVANKPVDLLQAMYVQFAWAVAGNGQYRQCAACQKFFELSPGVNRANRSTCSDACRVRLSRERRERARQLHTEGRTVKQIAREIGSRPAKVQEWISQPKE
jgi:hypothetical protein